MRISPHFTLDEAVFSSTAQRKGIDNTPPADVLENMKKAADQLEVVRVLMSRPIHVDSWYRCEPLNKAVGGAPNSAHKSGWAIDFICPDFGTPLEIVRAIIDEPAIRFDQCIQEGKWVHISFDPKYRRSIMTAHFGPNGTTYTQGV